MGLIKYNTNEYRPTSFRSFLDGVFNDDFAGGSLPSFTPKVDVSETDKEFEVQVHVPGVKKDEIKIDLDKNQLAISGERKMNEEKKERNFHSVESYYGAFRRSFRLPESVNQDKIDANYADGILTVKLPKDAKKSTTKQIVIK